MANARWKKIFADLWHQKARTILAALSIAVGIFAVGVVTNAYFLVGDAMKVDYEAANPRTARIYAEPFGQSLVEKVAGVPGVTAAEGRYDTWVKAADVNGKLFEVDLTSIASLDSLQVDRLMYESGSRTLGEREIFFERAGAEGMGLQVGGTVDLEMKDGQTYRLRIAGLVHDVSSNPFRFSQKTAAYVTPATMKWLGASELFNTVMIITDGSPLDGDHVRAVAERAAVVIQQSGVEVTAVNVNNPGQHPAQSIINTVLALMGALAVMSVFLSIFLVVNTVTALMAQQIRQIGVMKALGARTEQLVVMFLVLVEAYGLLAALLGVPSSALVAYGLTRWLVKMLNADMVPFSMPGLSLVLQAVIGLVVPLLGALVPVLGSARLTIREAISNYGLSTSGSRGLLDRVLESVRGLPRPLILSLRNAFRRKSRLALTLLTLSLGGAIFIAVFSVRDSLYMELEKNYGYYQSDVNVELAHSYPIQQVQAAVQDLPGVVDAEGWFATRLNVLHIDGVNSDQVITFAPPADTRLITPVLMEGRWLQPDDVYTVVLDNHFKAIRPDIKVNDSVLLRINKQDFPFQVVGFFTIAGNSTIGTAYLHRETLEMITGAAGLTNAVKVVTNRHDAVGQMEMLHSLQARLKEQKIDAFLQTGSDVIANSRSTINLLISLLLFMAVLIALVGGLGLMGTMSMNVLERTREIGVMRSIGAVNGAIFQLVVVEGVLIGLISWSLGWLVSFPIAKLLDHTLGNLLMSVPLEFVFSAQGLGIWLVVVVALSALASLVPARGAVRLTIRDVLAYE